MTNPGKPGKVSVPEHAHPHARLVFQLMHDTGTTYDALEWKSGVLRSTLKSYRSEKTPSLQSIEALLGSFGYALVPVPPLASLKPETLEKLDEIGLDFVSDHAALAAVMARVCKIPVGLPEQPANVSVKVTHSRPRKLNVIEGQAALFEGECL